MKSIKFNTLIKSPDGHVISDELRESTIADRMEAERLHKIGKCTHSVVYIEAGHSMNKHTCIMCNKWWYSDGGQIDERDLCGYIAKIKKLKDERGV